MVLVEEWRTCKDCKDTMPLDVQHFYVDGVNAEGVTRYRGACRLCISRRASERDRQLRYNPETRETYLETRRMQDRAAYHRDPVKHAERKRAQWLAIKADPERRARYKAWREQWRETNRQTLREYERMDHRLRAEREGRTVISNRPILLPDGSWGQAPSRESVMRLDVGPVMPLLQRLAKAYGVKDAAVMTGLDDSALSRLLKGAQPHLDLDTADRLCIRLGFNLFDFWPDL